MEKKIVNDNEVWDNPITLVNPILTKEEMEVFLTIQEEYEQRSQYMRPDGTYLTKEEAAKEIIVPYTKKELEAIYLDPSFNIEEVKKIYLHQETS